MRASTRVELLKELAELFHRKITAQIAKCVRGASHSRRQKRAKLQTGGRKRACPSFPARLPSPFDILVAFSLSLSLYRHTPDDNLDEGLARDHDDHADQAQTTSCANTCAHVRAASWQ